MAFLKLIVLNLKGNKPKTKDSTIPIAITAED